MLKTIKKLAESYYELGAPKLVLITSNPDKYKPSSNLEVVETDYSEESIKKALAPYKSSLKAVICRGDKYIQFLCKLVPHLPHGVPVSSEDSLKAATNKRLMRQSFAHKYPEITPSFLKIKDAAADTLDAIEQKVGYPLVIKPASLASSLMIQRCDNRQDLSSALTDTFAKLTQIYKDEDRHELPEVIVESYLEGELYSIDSYVRQPGTITHCPPVRYISANQMGIDDFFLYKRWVPTDLSGQDIEAMQTSVSKAIDALGLQFSSTHTEVIKTKDGWKIIELGPRLGRFRNIMYREAYGIDHGYNDVLVHLDKAPDIQLSRHSNCAAYSIYPYEEGILKEVACLGDIDKNVKSRVVYLDQNFVIGQAVRRAKNGGHALVEIIISNDNKKQFDQDCKWIEQNIKAVVKKDTL